MSVGNETSEIVGRGRRVVFINATGYWAGAEAMLLDLATHLNPARWRPLVLLPFVGPFSQALTEARVAWRVWPLAAPRTRQDLRSGRALLRLGVRLPPSVARLAAWLRHEQTALVHTNSSAALDGALAARLAGVPHVWHMRERLPLGAPLRGLWCRAMLSLSAAVVVNSRAVRNQWSTRAADPRLYIVPDGLDLSAFAPRRGAAVVRAELGLGDGPVIGMVGRINPIKGQSVFLDAAARLCADFPAAHFVLVGGALPAYEPLRQALFAQANAGPLAGRVTFTGEVSRAQVPEIMQVFDALAVPTITMEGFGLVVLEGMALGLPVAATLGGPEDLIVEGETGCLVSAGDAAALATALARLLRDPAHAQRLGKAGRARAASQFTLTQHVQRIETIYTAVTGHNLQWLGRNA
jgi:glycosyltransferase involved in cell wall biosynthesis